MAIGVQNFPNIDTTDPADYPNGCQKDDPAGIVGTPYNKLTNNDYVATWDKILRYANIGANGLPDNETNGYQYFEALKALPAMDGLAGIAGAGPCTLSGMAVVSTPFLHLAHGWLYYNGQLIEFFSTAIPTPVGADVVLVKIGQAPSTVRQAVLITGANVTNSSQFPLST